MKNILRLLIALILISFATYFLFNYFSPEDVNVAEIKENLINTQTYQSDIDINYLRTLDIDSQKPVIEEELTPGTNYQRYIASYYSEGNKIYGLLTVPNGEAPVGGFPAIVFNHGYIPPSQYQTTERYVSYVDNLARNGFVVFKIDLRGHGESGGEATGSYFSSGYTIDAISALKSLQKEEYVNPERIGMWGHSMAGNLILRAMLVEEDIKAGVIWSGAVYSYEDFAEYRLNDTSYIGRPSTARRITNPNIQKLREDSENVDFNSDFWKAVSLTQNIDFLSSPIQLNHSVDDQVVNVGYSRDLVEILKAANKKYEYHEYFGGGHNIESPYFEEAMQNTVNFFKNNL